MTKLKKGDKAPTFAVKDSKGRKISLSSLKGKKVVLYFYPKDSTPGCTVEACGFRDNIAEYRKKGVVVLGVSGGSEKSHNAFIAKQKLDFPLLMDKDFRIAKAYGVYGKKKFLGKEYMGISRTTFLIDEKGKVSKVYDDIDVKTHSDEILKQLG